MCRPAKRTSVAWSHWHFWAGLHLESGQVEQMMSSVIVLCCVLVVWKDCWQANVALRGSVGWLINRKGHTVTAREISPTGTLNPISTSGTPASPSLFTYVRLHHAYFDNKPVTYTILLMLLPFFKSSIFIVYVLFRFILCTFLLIRLIQLHFTVIALVWCLFFLLYLFFLCKMLQWKLNSERMTICSTCASHSVQQQLWYFHAKCATRFSCNLCLHIVKVIQATSVH